MRCIITGFDPFDNAAVNPSQKAVERLPETIDLPDGTKVPITRLILPTCCDQAWDIIQKTIAAFPPDERFALVMCGLADTREKITPEWFALNIRHYPIADNQGHQPVREPIAPDAPNALTSKVDIGALVDVLNAKGLKADLSFHAGTFVCNETYFRALNALTDDARCVGALFVHVPALDNYARILRSTGSGNGEHEPTPDPIDHYATALAEAAKIVLQAPRS